MVVVRGKGLAEEEQAGGTRDTAEEQEATVQSAMSRTESRGTHQRTDFTEQDDEQLHHTLIDVDGNLSTLAIRKGTSGTWVLSPSE